MNMNFGINGSFSVSASRPISISSSTPIGIIATADKGEVGLKKFNNADEGLAYIKEKNITQGTLKTTLKGISLQAVNSPLVVCIIEHNEDEAVVKNKILDGLDELKKADPITGISLKNGIIIVPHYSSLLDVAGKIDAIALKLWATGIIDNFDTDEVGVINFSKNFGSKNLLIGNGKYKADGVEIPFSALMAGLIAYHDNNTPFGWAKNHSNRVVGGVIGAVDNIEYLDGSDCEARRLRQNGVSMILKDIGWRSYGFETTDIDPIWQSLDRVRTFNRLMTTILEANKWARDREADQLIWVRKSVMEFMSELKGNGVVIGFDVYFDETKNTKASVSAGRFYMTVKIQDMPSIRELNIELVYADDWSDVLINYINS